MQGRPPEAERFRVCRIIHLNAARITAQQNLVREGQHEVTQELPRKILGQDPANSECQEFAWVILNA